MPNLKLREIIRQQRDGEDGTQRGAKGVDPDMKGSSEG